jgi:hypothetical protein
MNCVGKKQGQADDKWPDFAARCRKIFGTESGRALICSSRSQRAIESEASLNPRCGPLYFGYQSSNRTSMLVPSNPF